MIKNVTDWCCAGCDRTWKRINNYPPLKIPTGEVDMSNYQMTRMIGVTYNRYCLECAKAILSPEWKPRPKRRFWQFWRWFESKWDMLSPEELWLREHGLTRLTKEALEKIYEQLPQ